jgi:two-component system CheB/CheR fusion protein
VNQSPKPDAGFEKLLDYLRANRGFDFTGYKQPTLVRRIAKRMSEVKIESFDAYVDYLEVHPGEFAVLFNTLLINVTSFFRDPAAWKFLAETVVPRLLADNGSGEPLRIWSAGCASGEEAYSLAMVLCEAVGKDDFRRRIKIYASDADHDALIVARQGIYGVKEVNAVPEDLRKKYFDLVGGRYAFNPDVRRALIFGRHDLVQDAPMSRLDLLVCRNTLMYFNVETQRRILSRFNYALRPAGFLFLGKAEMLLLHSALFAPVELKHRIFSKISQVSMRERLLVFASDGGGDHYEQANRHVRLREAALESGQAAQVLVDVKGALVMANQLARQLFSIEQRDIGRPFQDTEVSYRPIELRSLIERAYAERQTVVAGNIERPFNNGEERYLEVQVTPLQNGESTIGASITFVDMTRYHELEGEVQRARQEAETVNEELQSSNEELQSTNEELETTNEELQSTNEELETTNEELQSTNEELETMNEELQSTNEELQTINDELRQRTDELNESATFLTSILSSLRGGVVVVDPEYRVLVWNALAEELWGMRFDEVKGKSFLDLDIGLPVGRLRNPIRASMADSQDPQELILDAVNRRGRKIKCRVLIHPYQASKEKPQGAVIMMEEMGM